MFDHKSLDLERMNEIGFEVLQLSIHLIIVHIACDIAYSNSYINTSHCHIGLPTMYPGNVNMDTST